MPKETLKELEYELREVQGEVEILASLDMDTEEAEKALSTLKGRILKKTEAIDAIITSFNIGDSRIDAMVGVLQNEIACLKQRKQSLSNNKERLMNYLAEAGVVSKDNPLRTSAHTYFIQSTNGELKIADPNNIPREYIKTEVVETIDKKALRNDVIAKKVQIDGVSVESKTRVSRR